MSEFAHVPAAGQLPREHAAARATITERCYARIGIMGNPSDGFEGKTLSALIGNFYAECSITGTGTAEIQLLPHTRWDPTRFSGLQDLHEHTLANGYYGGIRLLQATCRVFYDYLTRSGLRDRVLHVGQPAEGTMGFTMSYDTCIPRCVGLSGSSAIIVSAFRCLLSFHGGLCLEQLGISKDVFPSTILSIEKAELGISAGLQDRVVQTYGGLVHMDFTPRGNSLARAPSQITMEALTDMKPGGRYTPCDPSLLPALYLAYNTQVGGDSGAVHNTVKERWGRRDPELVRCMQELGTYADESLQALLVRDYMHFAACFAKNFSMRRRLYGDAVVGEKNIAVVMIIESHGMAAKFTGSGGAILCVRNDTASTAGTFYAEAQEKLLRTVLQTHGFEFVRILPVPHQK